MAFKRCEIRRGFHEFDGFERAAMQTRVLGEGNGPDIRWEIELYDKQGRKRSHIYLSRNLQSQPGVEAEIDGSMVQVNKPLIVWLDVHLTERKCVSLNALP